MSDSLVYPARIERDEDGRYVVTFSDFGWRATDGARLEEALAEAQDLLRELIAATIREGRDLPKPSKMRASPHPII
ncbi:MAG: type II toxin-antitoxin system HicB family antitoxin [Gammaproteobacteria bacterium]|nr:type II toxin-antitoxin system HicB family antitoxin [Gammaproteobacteria bacterium]MCY4278827.1 type II toxin-antitoxin system HicB family antitoxin [Gammaproteobacteria bacterium]